jgi:hypothetical protein
MSVKGSLASSVELRRFIKIMCIINLDHRVCSCRKNEPLLIIDVYRVETMVTILLSMMVEFLNYL